jgi:hypothetical protein
VRNERNDIGSGDARHATLGASGALFLCGLAYLVAGVITMLASDMAGQNVWVALVGLSPTGRLHPPWWCTLAAGATAFGVGFLIFVAIATRFPRWYGMRALMLYALLAWDVALTLSRWNDPGMMEFGLAAIQMGIGLFGGIVGDAVASRFRRNRHNRPGSGPRTFDHDTQQAIRTSNP